MHQNCCWLLFETAYIPSSSHRALIFYKQTLKAPHVLIFVHAMLKGRQQKFDGSVLGIGFLRALSSSIDKYASHSKGITSLILPSPSQAKALKVEPEP